MPCKPAGSIVLSTVGLTSYSGPLIKQIKEVLLDKPHLLIIFPLMALWKLLRGRALPCLRASSA